VLHYLVVFEVSTRQRDIQYNIVFVIGRTEKNKIFYKGYYEKIY